MAEQIEVGILDRDAFADPRALPDPRGVAQVLERHFEDLLDFVRAPATKSGLPIGEPTTGCSVKPLTST